MRWSGSPTACCLNLVAPAVPRELRRIIETVQFRLPRLKVCDLLVFSELEKQVAWRGPGQHGCFLQENHSRAKILGTLLHELAHPGITDDPGIEATPLAVEFQTELIAAVQMRWPSPRPTTCLAGFRITICYSTADPLHLHARAWSHGYAIGLPTLTLAGWFYELSPAWRYLRALGDEPKRLAGCTLAEIDVIEPPAEFTELWRRRRRPVVHAIETRIQTQRRTPG